MRKKLIAAIVLLFSFLGFLFFENLSKTYYTSQNKYHIIIILSESNYKRKLTS